MTKKEIRDRIDDATNLYFKTLEEIGESVRVEKILPYCKKKRWEFMSGNGTFAFFPITDAHYRGAIADDKIDKRILDLLYLDVDRECFLGNFVGDVLEGELK
jgi:hypothetical protein